MKNKIIAFNIRSLKQIKNIFVIFLLIFCSIVGVGFISGAEILSFFAKFDKYSCYGIIAFFILVFLLIYKITCESCLKYSSYSIKNYLDNNQQKYKKIINIKKSKIEIKKLITNKMKKKIFTLNNIKYENDIFLRKINKNNKNKINLKEINKNIIKIDDYLIKNKKNLIKIDDYLLKNNKNNDKINSKIKSKIKNKDDLELKNKYKIKKINKIKTNKLTFRKKIKELILIINVLFISGAMFSGLKIFSINLYNNNYFIFYIFSVIVIFILLYKGVEFLSKFEIFVFIFIIFLIIYFLFSFSSFNKCLKIDNCFVNYLKYNCLKLSKNFKNSLKYNFNNCIFSNLNFKFNEINFGCFLTNFKLIFDCNLIINNSVSVVLQSVCFSILYVFMNFLQVQPIAESCQIKLNNKKQCFLFSLIFSLFLTFTLIVFTKFLICNKDLFDFSMPFLGFFNRKEKIIALIFKTGLVFGLISTLVSCLIGLKSKLKLFLNTNNFYLSSISFLFGLILGFLPFNIFIEVIYPILGFFNLFCFVFC